MTSDDIPSMVRDAATQPEGAVPMAAIVSRARRQRAVRRSTALLLPLLLLLLGGTVLSGLGEPAVELVPADRGEPAAGPTVPDPAPTASPQDPTEPPSQRPEDAARDGVVPELAALPFDVRVGPVDMGSVARVETPEGVWVLSRPVLDHFDLADGCGIGATEDPQAVDGRDLVCVLEYGEVLLLDGEEREIVRAFPMPGIPPQALAVSEDAVYCMRQGDGALGHSTLCRIDRSSFDWFVRVFPRPEMPVEDSGLHIRDGWEVEVEDRDRPVFHDLMTVEDQPIVIGDADVHPVDPATLELGEADELDASREFGSITGVDAGARQLLLDPAEYLVGDDADRAYEEETGEDNGAPNDHHILDPDDDTVARDVAADVEVQLIRASEPGTRQRSTWEEFTEIWTDGGGRDGEELEAEQRRRAFYWLTVVDGAVVRIEQQYQP